MTIDNKIHHFAASQESGDNVERHIKLFETHGYHNVNIANEKKVMMFFLAKKTDKMFLLKNIASTIKARN